MDASDKIAQALRLARSTGGKLELDRAKEARRRAPGQIAPSKYMPGVPRQVHADGGEVDNDAQALRISKLQSYRDPKSEKLGEWNWRPLSDVSSELGNMTEIPSHVQNFGRFMDDTAKKAKNQGLTARDLIKAYTITLSSIQRQAQSTEKLRAKGMPVPKAGPTIRPEGAFGEWLHTPGGQAYLDAAEKGQVDERALDDMDHKFHHYGLVNLQRHGMRWAAENLPGKEGQVSQLVAAAMENASPAKEWRGFAKNLHGIDTSKAGFVASLMGRGDQPTFDARQRILHTGMTSTAVGKMIAGQKMNPKAQDALDRLTARQEAMNLDLPEELSPYYQHLAHHAVWDQAEGDQTTHQDVMDSMRHAAVGGRIDDEKEGDHISSHPVAMAMRLAGLPGISEQFNNGMRRHSPEEQRFKEYMSKVLDPRNPEHFDAAKQIAGTYDVGDTSYSGFKQHPVMPSGVTTKIKDIPGAIPKPTAPMGWKDFYDVGKGGTLFTLGGDRSNLGRLTHINGKKLAWPVDLHAGTKYQREPNKEAVWANDKTAASTLRNNILRASENGKPVFGAFAPMGPESIDSSKNMMDAVMSHVAASDIDPSAMKDFDEKIRQAQHVYNGKAGSPADKREAQEDALEVMKKWPGLKDAKKARDFAFKNMNGNQRAYLIKMMDRKMYLDAGFPSMSATRAAITDPDLLHVAGNMMGGNIVRLDPSDYDRSKLSFEHATYNTPTKGEYVGTVPFAARHDVMPDYVQSQVMDPKYVQKKGQNAGEPLLIHPYSPNPTGRGSFRGNTELRQGIQPINEKMLESIQMGEERRNKYGFANGGFANNKDQKFDTDAIQKAVYIAKSTNGDARKPS